MKSITDSRIFLSILLISTSIYSFGQSETSNFDWNNPRYDEVKAYVNGSIIENGQLNPNVIGVSLNKNHIEKVLKVVLGDIYDIDDDFSFCFLPHHGIVFFKEKKPVAHLSICFVQQKKDCSKYNSTS